MPTMRSSVALALLVLSAACRDAAPEPGVAHALAERRAGAVHDLRYDVRFDLPAARDSAVRGEVELRFTWQGGGEDLVLDFRAPAGHVASVSLDGAPVSHRVVPDHIVIAGALVDDGERRVRVAFTSTDAALNRQGDFLYALFVPDRASTAFPVFEQPDLKARVTMALGIPAEWEALANGALVARDSAAGPGRHLLRFAETQPISTYLIAFAAGRMQRVEAERAGRRFTMYHRETDTLKVARNADAIFGLHAAALGWLEDYTGIAYPFGKFDFLAVPAFQFGGMEHPGAVWYRADAILLDEAPSRTQELGRASLIAHETAHMWFGDLVTMRWFDDVWMKEVFANFMAAKIVAPSFPDVDHGLRFFQAHHPTAYGVDRTPGANPIRQELANLREAGSLYGAIIYQKAPVVMRQLEQLVGDTTFRDGLREYLGAHRFGNATWTDLVTVLDARTPEDVRAWSRAWVEEPGRPTVVAGWADGALVLRQRDVWDSIGGRSGRRLGGAVAADRDLRWPQAITALLAFGETQVLVRGTLHDGGVVDAIAVPLPPALQGRTPDLILPGVDGVSYGRFPLDASGRAWLLAGVERLRAPVQRAVAWQTLHEEMLDGALPPAALLDAALRGLALERDELVAAQITGLVRGTYWRFLDAAARRAAAPRVERALWDALDAARTPGRKGALFGAIVATTLSDSGVARLERILLRTEVPAGFPVTEAQQVAIAEGLALRGHPRAEALLDTLEARLTNPDRLARQRFMRAALSADPVRRDSLFRSFARVEQRRRESWVLDAMAAMHHPLRATEAMGQLEPALALVPEIQATGDIFFPLRWLNATLDGHQSAEAARLAARHLNAHPELAPRLRGKMLQAMDDLLRAARIVDGWDGTAAP